MDHSGIDAQGNRWEVYKNFVNIYAIGQDTPISVEMLWKLCSNYKVDSVPCTIEIILDGEESHNGLPLIISYLITDMATAEESSGSLQYEYTGRFQGIWEQTSVA